MICKHCASNVKSDCRYCPHCGMECPAEPETVPATATALVPTSHGLAVAPLTSSELHNLLTQGNLYRQRGKWEQAIDCCITVLRADPGNPTAHALLGEIYYGQGKIHDAVHWFRLAVELHPNPNDVARLRQIEAEIRRSEGRGELIAQKGKPPLSPIHADGGYSTGTAQLMGLPPRKWLHVITAISLSFTGMMLLALMASRGLRKAPAQTLPSSTLPASALPRLNSSRMSNETASAVTPKWEPALPSNAALMDKNRDAAQPKQKPVPTEKPLPLAPILGVRSLPPDSLTKISPPAPPAEPADTKPETQSLALPNGMTLAGTHRDPVSQAVSLLVVAPAQNGDALSAAQRETMLRNVYRASRIHFATDSTAQRVSVYVQAGKTGATVMIADISRMASDALNPETESLDMLESRLLSLKTADTPESPRPVLNGMPAP